MRISVAAHDTPLLHGLCLRYQRERAGIIAAGVLVGLRHLDALPMAALTWHATPAPVPSSLDLGDLAELPDWVKIGVDNNIQYRKLILPNVYSQIVEATAAAHSALPTMRPNIRSALLWIGLHHADEFADALTDLVTAETGGVGSLAYAYYGGELAHTPHTAEGLRTARMMLRRNTPVDKVATTTGIPASFLTAIRDENNEDDRWAGGEQLALMPAV
ncbi:hypothetical protein [Gordonia alkanivorans]|uniref:hypothetical protein n=1 Tax=Gordonia alkanivorans TaxID=84096 RepID=UPI0004B47DBF|nr:hypothetical protein [Gordonia alkanivorans]